jgi:hypothetical protein
MNPGDLRERITFQTLNGKTYSNIASNPTVWAAVEGQGGNGQDETWRFRIRYRSDLRSIIDVTPADGPGSMRIVWKNRVLEITDVIETVYHQEIQIIAKHHMVESPHLASGVRRKHPA